VLEQLAESQAEQVFQKVVEQALAGDVASQRMILDRVYVPPRAPPINVAMPAINRPEDVISAIGSICTAIGEGRLTADETNALSAVAGRLIQLMELQDHEQRIAALEQARGKQDENGNASEA
jgi:hypothetical protein